MQKLIRLLTLATLVGTTLATASCGSKSDDPQAQPQVQTATLSGQVTPAGSVTTVTATDASGTATTATVMSTGAYSFAGLKVGTYTLSFAPAAGYAAPATVSVALAVGGTTAPATTAVLAAASASYTVDGTAMTAAYVFSVGMSSTNSRMLTFTANPGGAPPTISVFLDGLLPTVGTRSLTANANTARYTAPDFVLYLSDLSPTSGAALSGTLTISSVNATARVFSGTFSFVGNTGNPTATSPLTRLITNGVFTNVPY